MISSDDPLTIYLAECREHLTDIEATLLGIEKGGDSADRELHNKVFRAAHSIKGGAPVFHLFKIEELAHETEHALSLLREKKIPPSTETINVLLLAFDALKDLIHNVENSNDADIATAVCSLKALSASKDRERMKAAPDFSQTADKTGLMSVSEQDILQAKQKGCFVYRLNYDWLQDLKKYGRTPRQLLRHWEESGVILGASFLADAAGTLEEAPTDHLPFQLIYATDVPPAMIHHMVELPSERIQLLESPAPPVSSSPLSEAAPQNMVAKTPEVPVKDSAAPSETTLRVNVHLLESLMNLAGELVLSRNQLLDAISRNDFRSISTGGQRINLVTSELQEVVMQTRMQPIGQVFGKFPRVVRDLSQALGKSIELQMEGSDVEMDKALIEGLSDPLTHMIRNSADHGIETAEARSALGKVPTGRITLKAYHQAGLVLIELADDGHGIDLQKVCAIALEKGLVSREQMQAFSDQEKMHLIFLPGLSTADAVTGVSGRGVGMDVVKNNLEKLGGKIEIESEPGLGVLFRIKLPLTLAIIPSLLLQVGEERFAIPQVNIRELIRIPSRDIQRRNQVVGDAEVLVLRRELIPIVALSNVLGIERSYLDSEDQNRKKDRRLEIADRRSPRISGGNMAAETNPKPEDASVRERRASLPPQQHSDRRFHAHSDLNIVILTSGLFQYGLVVEELRDNVEIVVKPLGRHLKGLTEYAGATILGDGRIALILDASGLALKAGLASHVSTAKTTDAGKKQEAEKLQTLQSLLLFQSPKNEPCAMPLSLVTRVEHIQGSQIENVGSRRTLQYRNTSLPLVVFGDMADVDRQGPKKDWAVVVVTLGEKEAGLIAAMPVEALETAVSPDLSTHKKQGVAGSAILKGKTTLILDIFDLVQEAYPEWNLERPLSLSFSDAPMILLAEDSHFFRSQLKKVVEKDGYQVIAAEDGQAAWELLERHADKIKLIVTDIEMPRLNGLQLTERIRADARFKHIPVIAITTLADQDNIVKGYASGVSDYHIKLDEEKLMTTIRQYWSKTEIHQ